MAILGPHSVIIFGLLGNIVSFLVYLAPLPTFYRIFKKKSTQGFQSIPYLVALFGAMLLLYYASLKGSNAFMLITINGIGCIIESLYLLFFMIYATKTAKIYTTKLLILFNIGALGLIVLLTYLLSKSSDQRLTIVGWICAVFSVCVFAAPLSIIRQVIRTKSVEYMPFSLSCCLTICAVMWLLYGLSIKDYYIATPNILGMAFGATQMILYLAYRTRRNSEILPVAAAVVDPKDTEEANNNGAHMNMIITGAADPRCNHHHRHDSSNGEVEIKAVEPDQLLIHQLSYICYTHAARGHDPYKTKLKDRNYVQTES